MFHYPTESVPYRWGSIFEFSYCVPSFQKYEKIYNVERNVLRAHGPSNNRGLTFQAKETSPDFYDYFYYFNNNMYVMQSNGPNHLLHPSGYNFLSWVITKIGPPFLREDGCFFGKRVIYSTWTPGRVDAPGCRARDRSFREP